MNFRISVLNLKNVVVEEKKERGTVRNIVKKDDSWFEKTVKNLTPNIKITRP